jgi:HD-GYP domain-containing protein (c-di-GMP phosphodiesterase class II)
LEKIIKNNHITCDTDYYVIEKEYIRDLLYSASLHDLGKVGIDDSILKSKKRLTKKQYEIMKLHSVYGYQRLSSITKMNKKKSFLELASILAGNHHEKWNGHGYPNGKKEFEIPLSSRIVAIADVYDALRIKRPYKDAYSHEEAVRIILKHKNINFDPVLTDIFYKINKKFNKAFEENLV